MAIDHLSLCFITRKGVDWINSTSKILTMNETKWSSRVLHNNELDRRRWNQTFKIDISNILYLFIPLGDDCGMTKERRKEIEIGGEEGAIDQLSLCLGLIGLCCLFSSPLQLAVSTLECPDVSITTCSEACSAVMYSGILARNLVW